MLELVQRMPTWAAGILTVGFFCAAVACLVNIALEENETRENIRIVFCVIFFILFIAMGILKFSEGEPAKRQQFTCTQEQAGTYICVESER